MAGAWKLVAATSGPISTFLVASARPARLVQTSHGPTLPVWSPIQEVVTDPDRVEAHALRGLGHVAQLRPANGPLDFGQLDSDFEWSGHRPRVYPPQPSTAAPCVAQPCVAQPSWRNSAWRGPAWHRWPAFPTLGTGRPFRRRAQPRHERGKRPCPRDRSYFSRLGARSRVVGRVGRAAIASEAAMNQQIRATVFTR